LVSFPRLRKLRGRKAHNRRFNRRIKGHRRRLQAAHKLSGGGGDDHRVPLARTVDKNRRVTAPEMTTSASLLQVSVRNIITINGGKKTKEEAVSGIF